jgi:hypothetical protein
MRDMIGGMETKKCIKCLTEKPLSDFSWKDMKNGRRQAKCKVCYRKHRNQWYVDHREREIKTIKARTLKWRKEAKAWINGYKAEHPCTNCNEKRIPVLQFHHLDPKEKDLNLGAAANHGWSIARIEKEIAKCIVLCANCHIMEHERLRGRMV